MTNYTKKNDTSLAILNAFFLGDPDGTLTARELRAIVEQEIQDDGVQSEAIVKHMHKLLDVHRNVKVESTGEDKVWHGLKAKPVEIFLAGKKNDMIRKGFDFETFINLDEHCPFPSRNVKDTPQERVASIFAKKVITDLMEKYRDTKYMSNPMYTMPPTCIDRDDEVLRLFVIEDTINYDAIMQTHDEGLLEKCIHRLGSIVASVAKCNITIEPYNDYSIETLVEPGDIVVKYAGHQLAVTMNNCDNYLTIGFNLIKPMEYTV